jgi:hypothetical protein
MDPTKYPAAVLYVVNLIMGVVVSFNFLSADAAKVVSTVVMAATSLVVVFLVHPFAVAVFTGAFQTFLVALGGFGFHLTDEKLAAVIALAGAIATWFTHRNATPLVAFRKGTTVTALEAAPYQRAKAA